MAYFQLKTWADYITAIPQIAKRSEDLSDNMSAITDTKTNATPINDVNRNIQKEKDKDKEQKKKNKSKQNDTTLTLVADPMEDMDQVIAEIHQEVEEREIQASVDVATLILTIFPDFCARDENVKISPVLIQNYLTVFFRFPEA